MIKQRIINCGEKVTGVPIPPGAQDIYGLVKDDRYITEYEVRYELRCARTERREWWLDVAKCSVSDLLGKAADLVINRRSPVNAEKEQ